MACPTTKGIYDNDEVFEVINVARWGLFEKGSS
jgi:hypothetical protein